MTDWDERALEIASFRYRIIADAAEADGEGVRGAVESAAAREYVDANGNRVKLTARTLWRWLGVYRRGGLNALRPKRRRDARRLRAFTPNVLERAVELRRENDRRATKTVIDILTRLKVVSSGSLKRSTLDRHLDRLGVSRRRLRSLGIKTFKMILTSSPLELVVADFHRGPYVRIGIEERARRSLLLAFIDHFSRYIRYILEARYYLHEDFAVCYSCTVRSNACTSITGRASTPRAFTARARTKTSTSRSCTPRHTPRRVAEYVNGLTAPSKSSSRARRAIATSCSPWTSSTPTTKPGRPRDTTSTSTARSGRPRSSVSTPTQRCVRRPM